MMTQKNLHQFLQIVFQDTEIQEKLNSTADQASYINLLVELGREGGYSFTKAQVEDALNNYTEKADKESTSVAQLSEQELALVAGGFTINFENFGLFKSPRSATVSSFNPYNNIFLGVANTSPSIFFS